MGLQMDWVQFLQRVFSKSGVTVRPDHPVIFLGGEKALANIITFIEHSDPRVLGQYGEGGGLRHGTALRAILQQILAIISLHLPGRTEENWENPQS
jgi:hypothetical protein